MSVTYIIYILRHQKNRDAVARGVADGGFPVAGAISWMPVVLYSSLCCSVLQCVAACCSVLQCAAVCCSVLQCVAVCYRILAVDIAISWMPVAL